MQTAQPGDHVQVHYVKRFQDGTIIQSQSRGPLAVTVGTDHPRLPGLGMALVGLEAGGSATVQVSPDNAYGRIDPSRVRRWARSRFGRNLTKGKWVRVENTKGKRRFVRIVDIDGKSVIVDTNHRLAGQSMELEVQLIAIQASGAARDL